MKEDINHEQPAGTLGARQPAQVRVREELQHGTGAGDASDRPRPEEEQQGIV